MKLFFKPNIDARGRRARAVTGILCLIAGVALVFYRRWPGVIAIVAGLFCLFEAKRGWCVARACGIKTKM